MNQSDGIGEKKFNEVVIERVRGREGRKVSEGRRRVTSSPGKDARCLGPD